MRTFTYYGASVEAAWIDAFHVSAPPASETSTMQPSTNTTSLLDIPSAQYRACTARAMMQY